MRKGLFITFEGPDASGKSTQLRLLQGSLKAAGREVIVAREPGGTEIGEKIRRVILDRENAGMDYMAEALLYAAARAQLVFQVIRPALEEGKTVLCDRFVDSSIAYQGFGRKLGEAVERINAYAVGDCTPDVTFLLKLNPEAGERRRMYRENDRIESEAPEYHKAVYEAYLTLERLHPQRIIAIDGARRIEEISEMINKRVDHILRIKNVVSKP
jgi:dTMP kinase